MYQTPNLHKNQLCFKESLLMICNFWGSTQLYFDRTWRLGVRYKIKIAAFWPLPTCAVLRSLTERANEVKTQFVSISEKEKKERSKGRMKELQNESSQREVKSWGAAEEASDSRDCIGGTRRGERRYRLREGVHIWRPQELIPPSVKSILFVRKFCAFFDTPSPLLCGRHIYGSPLTRRDVETLLHNFVPRK